MYFTSRPFLKARRDRDQCHSFRQQRAQTAVQPSNNRDIRATGGSLVPSPRQWKIITVEERLIVSMRINAHNRESSERRDTIGTVISCIFVMWDRPPPLRFRRPAPGPESVHSDGRSKHQFCLSCHQSNYCTHAMFHDDIEDGRIQVIFQTDEQTFHSSTEHPERF